MYRYAQIDNDGNVVCDSQLSNRVISNNMIEISDDYDLINKKYNFSKKDFEIITTEKTVSIATLEDKIDYLILKSNEVI